MDIDKIIKIFIIPFLILVAIKVFFSQNLNSPIYKGHGYQVTKPPNWIISKDKPYMGVFANTGEIESVTFVDPVEKKITSMPKDSISIFSTKLDTPGWIDVLFPEILNAISFEANKIIKKGDMNIDDQVAKWVLYEDKNMPIWVLEFYFTNEKTDFFKIRCSCDRETFRQCSKICEETRQSFKFVYALF